MATVVRGGDADWRAIKVPGISVKLLRSDKATGESTALVRFAPNTRFPAHDHPAGEEVFVVEGEVTIGGDRLKAGHGATSEGGCVFLVTLPKPVVFLKD